VVAERGEQDKEGESGEDREKDLDPCRVCEASWRGEKRVVEL
jgi:hypothetical protein